jgi:two-component system sensor histidine kinase and response regulator WspE
VRVLVVEDDETIRVVLRYTLTRMGICVETATGGEEGWLRLREEPFDLLITDHEMPDLQGLDLIRRLRAAASTLPVILISGRMP